VQVSGDGERSAAVGSTGDLARLELGDLLDGVAEGLLVERRLVLEAERDLLLAGAGPDAVLLYPR
jgi:hypothetical protein